MKMLPLLLTTILFLSGCATAYKISGVQIGMTRQEVIAVMGPPQSTSAQGEVVYLNYALAETSDDAFKGWTTPYFVRLVDGKVDSFGRTGDFDSTKTPTVRIETDSRIKQDVQVDEGSSIPYEDLKRLQELRDAGAITEDEYQTLKSRILQ